MVSPDYVPELSIEQVTFKAPVSVGDLLQLTSQVLYTRSLDEICAEETATAHETQCGGDLDGIRKRGPEVCLRVEARVTRPEERTSALCNVFYITFTLPDSKTVCRVLPDEKDYADWTAARIVEDKMQREEDRDCELLAAMMAHVKSATET